MDKTMLLKLFTWRALFFKCCFLSDSLELSFFVILAWNIQFQFTFDLLHSFAAGKYNISQFEKLHKHDDMTSWLHSTLGLILPEEQDSGNTCSR